MKGKGKKLASVLIIDTSGGLPVAGPVGYVIFGPCGDGILPFSRLYSTKFSYK